jgi:hypothetical protein
MGVMRRLSSEERKAVLPGDPTVDYPLTLPYGYEPKHGALVPKEGEREAVALIFDEALRAKSLDEIAQSLERENTPVPAGAEQWAPELVESILSNPVYVGKWEGFGRAEPMMDVDRWESAYKRLPLLAS